MTQTQLLAIERVRELIQDAYTAHQEYDKWHEPPLNDIQKTQLTVKLKNAVEKADEWLRAIEEEATQ